MSFDPISYAMGQTYSHGSLTDFSSSFNADQLKLGYDQAECCIIGKGNSIQINGFLFSSNYEISLPSNYFTLDISSLKKYLKANRITINIKIIGITSDDPYFESGSINFLNDIAVFNDFITPLDGSVYLCFTGIATPTN